MSFKASSREVGDVTVIDMDGRITLGEGSALLRDLVRQYLGKGRKKIVLNLAGIPALPHGNVIEDFLCQDDGTYCIGNPGRGIMKRIFTLDSDFGIYRIHGRGRFELLPG